MPDNSNVLSKILTKIYRKVIFTNEKENELDYSKTNFFKKIPNPEQHRNLIYEANMIFRVGNPLAE